MTVLPPYQFGAVVGLLLSDAWLTFGISKSKNARLGLKQSYTNKEYLYFIFLILAHYCNSFPVYNKTRRKSSVNHFLVFTTRSLPCFTELYHLFYKNKVKVVPRNIYDLLTPVVIAHWIMGDGTATTSGLRLDTDSFTIKECV